MPTFTGHVEEFWKLLLTCKADPLFDATGSRLVELGFIEKDIEHNTIFTFSNDKFIAIEDGKPVQYLMESEDYTKSCTLIKEATGWLTNEKQKDISMALKKLDPLIKHVECKLVAAL